MTKFKFDPHPGYFATLREGCEYAFRQVVKQASPSMIGGECAYRGLSGKKCFVGHLIPDSIYRPDMENVPLTIRTRPPTHVRGSALEREYNRDRFFTRQVEALFQTELSSSDIRVLARLRGAHDEAVYDPFRQNGWVTDFKARCLPIFLSQGWTLPRLNPEPVL